MRMFQQIVSRLLFAVLMLGAGHAAANPTYHVSVDTSALAGQSGYLDFLFLGLAGAAPVEARLSGFSGAFGNVGFVVGDADGAIADGVRLGNADGWNEFGQVAYFGGLFSFDVSFERAPGADLGTTLGVALLDDSFQYLGSAGDIVSIAVQPGARDLVSVDAAFAAVQVPEPSTLALLAGAIVLLGVRRRSGV
jgi:hypothetical protein